MRVNISRPKRWISSRTIAGWICFWEDPYIFPDDYTLGDKLGNWLHKSKTLNKVLDWYNKRSDNNVSVRIDDHDTWDAGRTMAHIIVPLLKQLKETKHGSPFVDDVDVPEELKSTSSPSLTEEEKRIEIGRAHV